jgi:hypothetical protein
MSQQNFPYLAAALGLLFAIVIAAAGPGPAGEAPRLPLLMLLLMAELGFILTAVGAGMGIRVLLRAGLRASLALLVLLCIALALWLALRGLAMWPG